MALNLSLTIFRVMIWARGLEPSISFEPFKEGEIPIFGYMKWHDIPAAGAVHPIQKLIGHSATRSVSTIFTTGPHQDKRISSCWLDLPK